MGADLKLTYKATVFPYSLWKVKKGEKAEERRKYEKENGEPWGIGGRKRRKERNFFSFPRMFFAGSNV